MSVCRVLLIVYTHTASQGSCARTYTVQAGDFCDLISEENNVST